MPKFVYKYGLPLLFVTINLTLAAPVSAGLDNDLCREGTEIIPCCTACLLFCECEL